MYEPARDHFLSEVDLELEILTGAESYATWNHRLLQAQTTNDLDQHSCSHDLFREVPPEAQASRGESRWSI